MPQTSDDETFRPDAYVHIKEHERDLGELKSVINKLDERFGDDARFGDSFEKMAKNDRRVDLVVKDALRRLIKSDDETAQVIKSHIMRVDREWRAKFEGRLGFAVWSIFLVGITVLGDYLIQHH
jgi:hypothetical protein